MSMENVPVIDINALSAPRTLEALDLACRDWGFFQVVNHGIDDQVLAHLKQKMHEFFVLPKATKRSIGRTAENPWGYFDQELTKNTLDWKEVFDYGPTELRDDGSQPVIVPQWPRFVPGFKPAVIDYYRSCETLAFRLLAAISTNLQTPEEELAACFHPRHTSFVRLNYYPVCPKPSSPEEAAAPDDGYLGVNHHTDAGALTLLLQADEPGLEVLQGGNWHLVEPRENALVINIGDIVQVWSNDRYQAALHRVTANANDARYSAPFFLNPAFEANYAPLPSTVDSDHPPRYRAINWGEFRQRRSAGDYADHGEEVQINHYVANRGRSR